MIIVEELLFLVLMARVMLVIRVKELRRLPSEFARKCDEFYRRRVTGR